MDDQPLEHLGRQPGETQEAADIAVGQALVGGEIGKRGDVAAFQPTPKPLDAFGIPMRQHVARGGLCYEPFCGSGSQIMAGEANGRRVFAMEISPAYVDVAVERWQAETGRAAVLDGDGRTFAQLKTERPGDKADAAA